MIALRIVVYFNGGTTVQIDKPGIIKVDPQIRVLMVQDEYGDDFVFPIDSIKYWHLVKSKVAQ